MRLGASKKKSVSSEAQKTSAIDITAEDLIPRLTPQNVADLVLLSMVSAFRKGIKTVMKFRILLHQHHPWSPPHMIYRKHRKPLL